jgi:O-antigen biosynthesis protein WbqP
MKKRVFDLIASFIMLIVLSLPITIVALLVRFTSDGPALYWSNRMGKDRRIFKMAKFRSMVMGTPTLATHLIAEPSQYLTPLGSFLRKSSLDELPQLWSILIGDMSFVGPRPALFNQDDLISLRTQYGVDRLVPGLTGWAQVNYPYGNSMEDSLIKLQYDLYYIKHRCVFLDLDIVIKTISEVLFYRGQ